MGLLPDPPDLAPKVGGNLLAVLRGEQGPVLVQQGDQVGSVQLPVPFRLLLLPVQTEGQPHGGSQGGHQGSHIPDPAAALLNAGTQLMADGFGQDIFK